jgi:hypothetical protein
MLVIPISLSTPLRYGTAMACLGLLLLLTGCRTEQADSAGCRSCHGKIEAVSANHTSCTSCHGGNGQTRNKVKAHESMRGPANPSDWQNWDKSCGSCHPYQVERVKSTLMYTAAGMIRNIQLTWEGEDGKSYSSRGGNSFDERGTPLELKPVAELNNLSGELYRKFCSRCHVGNAIGDVHAAGHASGCAACHFPYNEESSYEGRDLTVRGRAPHSQSHRIEPLPGIQVCVRCHNRSGRIALSYQGLSDGNSGLVPTRNGLPGPVMLSGSRNAVQIAPDIHFARGMECIDCHTSRDIMGDGYAYANMYLQTEVRCEDCHGGAEPPQWREVDRENDTAVRESRNYPIPVRPGMKSVLTGKGRPYSNVFVQDGKVWVQGKRSGTLHLAKVITGTPEHTIVGHRRLDCFACHSRTVVQCYGCHTLYDKNETGMDYIKGVATPGAFSETEDYRMLYPFPLALNQKGKITPVTPGCQTFVTVVEENGTLSKDDYIARFKGKPQLRFAPFYSHNTGVRAVGCSECHANPAFLGFGQHVASKGEITGTLICEKSKDKPLDGFLTMKSGYVRAYSAITRENSRPLNGAEVKRTLAVNTCLVCHSSANDPIYRKGIDHRVLQDPLHRRLLSGD